MAIRPNVMRPATWSSALNAGLTCGPQQKLNQMGAVSPDEETKMVTNAQTVDPRGADCTGGEPFYGSVVRHLPASLTIVACFLCLWFVASPAVGAAVRGREAQVVSVNDTGHMHLIRKTGTNESTLIEEGKAAGTLPGAVRATFMIGGNTVPSGLTIYLHGGSISAQGIETLGTVRGQYVSFSGQITVSHGSGRYAHASGSGKLYGTVNRYNNDAVVAQVVGRLNL
jgi:hypothetical protein